MAFDGRVISNIGVLAAIVEGGSFARASEALGLSRSGVSLPSRVSRREWAFVSSIGQQGRSHLLTRGAGFIPKSAPF